MKTEPARNSRALVVEDDQNIGYMIRASLAVRGCESVVSADGMRGLQLVETEAKVIASGCPFCMTMLTDGLKSQSLEEEIRQLDVAEMLEESCALDQPTGVRAAMPEGARGFLDAIPALRNRECIVCGEGVAIPIRVRFDDLEPERRPASSDPSFARLWRETGDEEGATTVPSRLISDFVTSLPPATVNLEIPERSRQMYSASAKSILKRKRARVPKGSA